MKIAQTLWATVAPFGVLAAASVWGMTVAWIIAGVVLAAAVIFSIGAVFGEESARKERE